MFVTCNCRYKQNIVYKKTNSQSRFSQKTQQEMGWLGTEVFKNMITKNFLINCKFTINDVNNAIQIYGPSAPLIKGRMTAPPQIVQRIERVEVHRELLQVHKKVQL